MKTITYKETLQLSKTIYIDVRSPKEYIDGTIPNAISLPIFTNEERAKIGTIYKNISKNQARELGFDIATKKLSSMYTEIKNLTQNYSNIVIFCWRGGLRSKSIVTVMDLMKLPVYQLEGGYKAYRKHVLEEFNKWAKEPPKVIALHGNTGCGKTILLHKISEQNYPILDLEGLANHRGSVFGGIGLNEQPTQKNFEGMIYEYMRNNSSPVIVEAESSKIGKLNLPKFIIKSISEGIQILITCDKKVRINRLVNEYIGTNLEKNCKDMLLVLNKLKPFINTNLYNMIEDSIKNKDLKSAAELLLTNHYDPKYLKWRKYYKHFYLTIDTTNIDTALMKLKTFYDNQFTLTK